MIKIITISCEFGSGGRTSGRKVAQKPGIADAVGGAVHNE